MKNNSFGLYIHMPFCVRKCSYCDFLSFSADDDVKTSYTEALLREIEVRASLYRDRTITSVFIGGGTPTAMPASCLRKVMAAVRRSFTLCPEAEITVEMNPGTDHPSLEAFLTEDVNRISLGMQSFDDSELAALGRIHTAEMSRDTYDHLRRLGVDNINIDLMAALPHQTRRSFEHTLRAAAALRPEHISVYSLIIEEGTPFARLYREGEPPLPDEETEREMDALTERILSEAGYHRYEISNYARDGRECRHNRLYWECRDYLGIGLGAASLMDGCRFSVTESLDDYLTLTELTGSEGRLLSADKEIWDKLLMTGRERLSRYDRMAEFMFLGLRLTEGITEAEFRERFDTDLDDIYGAVIRRHIRSGLMCRTPGGYALTGRGRDISNTVMADFIIDNDEER